MAMPMIEVLACFHKRKTITTQTTKQGASVLEGDPASEQKTACCSLALSGHGTWKDKTKYGFSIVLIAYRKRVQRSPWGYRAQHVTYRWKLQLKIKFYISPIYSNSMTKALYSCSLKIYSVYPCSWSIDWTYVLEYKSQLKRRQSHKQTQVKWI